MTGIAALMAFPALLGSLLIWFAMTREEMFAPHFAWLRRDESENV